MKKQNIDVELKARPMQVDRHQAENYAASARNGYKPGYVRASVTNVIHGTTQLRNSKSFRVKKQKCIFVHSYECIAARFCDRQPSGCFARNQIHGGCNGIFAIELGTLVELSRARFARQQTGVNKRNHGNGLQSRMPLSSSSPP